MISASLSMILEAMLLNGSLAEFVSEWFGAEPLVQSPTLSTLCAHAAAVQLTGAYGMMD